MEWYFASPEPAAQVLRVLESWRGTPFAPNQAVKHVGVDCIRFAEAVMVECGAMRPVRWPEYQVWGKGAGWFELLLEHMDSVPEIVRLKKSETDNLRGLLPGDVLCFSNGAALHHVGVMALWPTFWHVLECGTTRMGTGPGGVAEAHLSSEFLQRLLRFIYRIRL